MVWEWNPLPFTHGYRIMISILCLFLPFVSNAREDSVPGSRYISARGAAMGDAFLPLADDGGSALFYNPAAIAHFRGIHFETMNIGLEANNDFLEMTGVDSSKAYSLPNYAPVLDKQPGKYPGFGGFYLPSFYMRGLALGVLAQTKLAAQRDPNGNINYRTLYQVIPAVGFGFNLARGILSFGYSLQWVNETLGRNIVPRSSPSLGYNQFVYEGAAFSHNAAFRVALPFATLPTVNIVARNIGSAKYYGSSIFPVADGSTQTGQPPPERMSIDISYSVQPRLGKKSYFNFVLEMRDLTNTSGLSPVIRAAAGLEFAIKDTLFLRAGLGSAYPSAGIGLKGSKSEFGLSWYSEELGSSYHDLRDVRFLLQYQVKIF